MSDLRGLALRRVLAFLVDWLVMAAWGGALFGAVVLGSGGVPGPPSGPWAGQAIGFVSMTLPVLLYFALTESSAMRGSLGKRALGLVVSGEGGGGIALVQALLRNGAKLVPWEFGHTLAQQAALSGEAGMPLWVLGPALVAAVGPAWWLWAIFATGRAPYDRWASARVERG